MANYRRGRVNEEIARELARILRDIKDPRVATSFISVTSVDCTADLRFAKIYYSAMGGKDGAAGVEKGLKSAAGYIRRELALSLDLRQTPELRFIRDDSIEHGAHIAELLRSVEADLRDDPEEASGEETDAASAAGPEEGEKDGE
ncbi:MAG: 30S ribosome-binding factor RbfA [Clostridia bacterium]|nr:30S ribosome-binding factor RbfA [Clostridia bacterium]